MNEMGIYVAMIASPWNQEQDEAPRWAPCGQRLPKIDAKGRGKGNIGSKTNGPVPSAGLVVFSGLQAIVVPHSPVSLSVAGVMATFLLASGQWSQMAHLSCSLDINHSVAAPKRLDETWGNNFGGEGDFQVSEFGADRNLVSGAQWVIQCSRKHKDFGCLKVGALGCGIGI